MVVTDEFKLVLQSAKISGEHFKKQRRYKINNKIIAIMKNALTQSVGIKSKNDNMEENVYFCNNIPTLLKA